MVTDNISSVHVECSAGNVRDMDDVRREDEKYAASKKKKGRSSSGTDTAAKPGRRTYDYSSLARELSVH